MFKAGINGVLQKPEAGTLYSATVHINGIEAVQGMTINDLNAPKSKIVPKIKEFKNGDLSNRR